MKSDEETKFLTQVDKVPSRKVGDVHRTWENGPVYHYMQGINGVSAGMLLTYDPSTNILLGFATDMIMQEGACGAGAMADVGADEWGWFIISGAFNALVSPAKLNE